MALVGFCVEDKDEPKIIKSTSMTKRLFKLQMKQDQEKR